MRSGIVLHIQFHSNKKRRRAYIELLMSGCLENKTKNGCTSAVLSVACAVTQNAGAVRKRLRHRFFSFPNNVFYFVQHKKITHKHSLFKLH